MASVLVPDTVYQPPRAAVSAQAAGPAPLDNLKGVIVRATKIQIQNNHKTDLLGRKEPADIYPIILVASDQSQQPAQLGSPGIFNGIFNGDDLPIADPGFTVERSLGAIPSFLDIHVLVMRSLQHQRDVAQAIQAALQSTEGQAAMTALKTIVTGANPIAGTAVAMGTSILTIVTKVLSQAKDEQIFYGVTSLEREPDNLGIGVTHVFTDDRNALVNIQVVGLYH
ncbi:MAG TPA: hypothetical protein VMA09_09520 [Candidatus Binataceae bacterium]|nr:hypothetical protein [Candidatus Binataceae bacterium]